MTTGITAKQFADYKISDMQVPCAACSPYNSNRPAAPVVIEGQHYCVWCALEIARGLLGRDSVAEIVGRQNL
jgi:hypothetical protein